MASIALVILLQAATAVATDVTLALPSGVKVHIVEAEFRRENFKIVGCDGGRSGCLINGQIPFGTTFDLPRTYVKRLTIEYQGRTHVLDSSGMFDAWGQRPLEVKGVVRYFGGWCRDQHNCQARGLFSDGHGTFVAEWKVGADHSARTVLTDSDDVVDAFMKNIDPPRDE